MTDIDSFKTKVIAEVDKILPRLIEMSDWIGKHPELGSEEVEASKLLAHETRFQGGDGYLRDAYCLQSSI
jgi:metal-dependent amidase/aminoacylase/carboxypeptidase family protein